MPSDDPHRLAPAGFGPRYETIRTLGRGGAGTVYLVRDAYLEQEIALKILDTPETRDAVEETQREFTLLAQIDHPAIARAYDFGYFGDRPYFTSEYIRGALPDAPIGESDALARIGLDIAEALEFLHAHRILHLDVKPSNIAIRRDPPSHAVLLDFGLWRKAGPPATGRLRGSLPFMAPEYFSGGELGPWTDAYALGVTLYRLATGRFPRPGAAGAQLSSAEDVPHPSDERAWFPAPVPPSQVVRGLSSDFDRVILECLALDPAARAISPRDRLATLTRRGSWSRRLTRPHAMHETVGRAAELDLIDEFLNDDEAPALVVTGSPGAGVSHVLREAKRRAQIAGRSSYLERAEALDARPGSVLRCLAAHLGEDADARRRWREFSDRLQRPRKARHHGQRDSTADAERRLRRVSELSLALGALSNPLVLLVDDLHAFDEISVGLIADTLRAIAAFEADRRPPIRIAVGYREEGSSVSLLREISQLVEGESLGRTLTVLPLSATDTNRLFTAAARDLGEEAPTTTKSAIARYEETRGLPARIIEAARVVGRDAKQRSRREEKEPPILPDDEGSLAVLRILQLLRTPASAKEIAGVLDRPRPQIERDLARLAERHLVRGEDDDLRRGTRWRALDGLAPVSSGATKTEERRTHRAVGRMLVTRAKTGDEAAIVEAAGHFVRAGDRTAVAEIGAEAARYLTSTFQNCAARDMLARVLKALPTRARARRVEVALEMADLYSRTGDLERGIDLLRSILAGTPAPSGSTRLRVLLSLAVLYGRRGEFKHASALFGEVIPRDVESVRGLEREELIHFVNEYAAMKGFTGDYEGAIALCESAMKLAGRSRSTAIRDAVLNLYATRAAVAVRTYDYSGASHHFESALQIAEAIGSVTNRAVILNNLGIVYNQCDRYADAIRAFREAERTCVQLDEGPSLVSIQCNLAILYAKRGEFAAQERAIAEAERLHPAAVGQRQAFFFDHARGLCSLYRGRFAEARAHLDRAIEVGSAMGDEHVAAFDRIYRGEALFFLAEYEGAVRALEAETRSTLPTRVRQMAFARLALVHAMTALESKAQAAIAAHASLANERPVPFLDAWDDLFLGWAASLLGDRERVEERLARAEQFFARHGFAPAHALTRWVRAENDLLAGDLSRVSEALRGVSDGNHLTAVLWLLLEARVAAHALTETRDRQPVGDLIARSGAALVGNPLPEWEARLERIRSRLWGGRKEEAVDADRARWVAHLEASDRDRYLESEHWRAWTAIDRLDVPSEQPVALDRAELPTASAACGPLRDGLVTRSPAMRRIAQTLDRVRGTDIPILLTGETGVGKDFIANIIHAESERANEPLAVISCAALAPELLEAELYGARAGAYTSLETDRPGILREAHGGTVLLDDIGALGAESQAKLLRVLSAQTFRPLGSDEEIEVDVRFLFTSARDLEAEVTAGNFRRDLFHRMSVLTIAVPPLRERAEDLEALAGIFLAEETRANGSRQERITSDALDWLRRRAWPGNVREFRNLLARIRVEDSRSVSVDALERVTKTDDTVHLFPGNVLEVETLPVLKERLERDYVVYHFRRLGGDTKALCRFLELGRRQLYRRCERLGISLRAERARLR